MASELGTRAGQPTLNNARRRRPAGPMLVEIERDATVSCTPSRSANDRGCDAILCTPTQSTIFFLTEHFIAIV